MKKLQLACLGLMFATSFSYAAASCNGFEVIVKNNSLDKLLGTTIKLNGADIKPSLVQLDSKDEVVFTVSGSDENKPMSGELVFKTISLPSKTIHIEFDLKNQFLVCEHIAKNIANEVPVSYMRMPSKVTYTIG